MNGYTWMNGRLQVDSRPYAGLRPRGDAGLRPRAPGHSCGKLITQVVPPSPLSRLSPFNC
jgi:hypothetical protein